MQDGPRKHFKCLYNEGLILHLSPSYYDIIA